MNCNLISLIFVIRLLYTSKSKDIDNASQIPGSTHKKGGKLAHLIQYEDFSHNYRKSNISTEVTGSSNLHRVEIFFALDIVNDKFYHIDLTINKNLLPKSFGITTYTKYGYRLVQHQSQQEKKHCYYHGTVRGVEGSKVIASTCRGFQGKVILPHGVFNVEPLLNGTYIFFPSDFFQSNELATFCLDSVPFDLLRNQTGVPSGKRNPRSIRNKEKGTERDEEQKYVELALVATRSTCKEFKDDRDAIESYLKAVANFVDGYYQPLNIHIVLVHIELWMKNDFFKTVVNAGDTLKNFEEYRYQQYKQYRYSDSHWVKADAFAVIHNIKFDSIALGIAVTGGMCTVTGNAICKYRQDPSQTANTVAHELGHTLGLNHISDGNIFQTCDCPFTGCLMSPQFSSGQTGFSQCSVENITSSLAMGKYECIYNIPDPSELVFGKGCGNSIVEVGEQCDCGPKQNCKSTCCNPDTCRLFRNATCDVGFCCENCQLLPHNTVCRESTNECDFPDRCTGTSPFCEKDFYKEDGTTCLGGQAYCTGGACVTRESACKAVFGKNAKSDDSCYKVNVYGNAGGNCGVDPVSKSGFKKCDKADKFCGKLLCIGGEKVYDVTELIWSSGCRTISVAEHAEPRETGLIRSGTICKAGHVCQNKKCKPVPASKCNLTCNSNQFCDNFGNCRYADGSICCTAHTTNGSSTPVNVPKTFSNLDLHSLLTYDSEFTIATSDMLVASNTFSIDGVNVFTSDVANRKNDSALLFVVLRRTYAVILFLIAAISVFFLVGFVIINKR